MTTRLAAEADAPAIAAIYNQGIAEGIATFETEPRSAADILHQLHEKGARFPTLVVERAGRVIAFAGAGPYRSRQCYAGIAEHSVYVDRAVRGTGAGQAALAALIRTYEDLGFWKLVSRIFPENLPSLALTSAPASVRSAHIAATPSSPACGGTASSSNACWAPPRRIRPPRFQARRASVSMARTREGCHEPIGHLRAPRCRDRCHCRHVAAASGRQIRGSGRQRAQDPGSPATGKNSYP
jgi:phosphinothricin acetyltransferase